LHIDIALEKEEAKLIATKTKREREREREKSKRKKNPKRVQFYNLER
jgi:hypothetical protein